MLISDQAKDLVKNCLEGGGKERFCLQGANKPYSHVDHLLK